MSVRVSIRQHGEADYLKVDTAIDSFEQAELEIFGVQSFPKSTIIDKDLLPDSYVLPSSTGNGVITDEKDTLRTAPDDENLKREASQVSLNAANTSNPTTPSPTRSSFSLQHVVAVATFSSHRIAPQPDIIDTTNIIATSATGQNNGSIHTNVSRASSIPFISSPILGRGSSMRSNRSGHSGGGGGSNSSSRKLSGTTLTNNNNTTTNTNNIVQSRAELSIRSQNSIRMIAGVNAQNLPVSDPIVLNNVIEDKSSSHSTTENHGNIHSIAYLSGTNSLRLNTGTIKTQHLSVMLSILQDPIQCGYMLQFCEMEHNSENLCFIMMVSRLRDAMSTDTTAWPKSYTDVDMEIQDKVIEEIISTTKWPSKRLHKPIIEKMVQSIWDNFLAPEAVTQICMSASVEENTKKRIKLLDLYGPEVYAETLLDPIKTMNKDVLPRFLASNFYSDMKLRLSSLSRPPQASSLIVPAPDTSPLLATRERFTEKRLFTLNEIITCAILYKHFLIYLEKQLSVENLLCIRMITIFEEYMNNNDMEIQAIDHAWIIYRYFIAPEAPYEISLHPRHKKELMISLAKPYIDMFDELKKSILSVLQVNFNGYKFTDEYRGLWKVMKEKRPSLVLW